MSVTFQIITAVAVVTARDLHFPVHTLSKSLCSDVHLGTIIDKHEAIGGAHPLSYSLSAGYKTFQIDQWNGAITIALELTDVNSTDFVLFKHVTDIRGKRTDMVINVTLIKPTISAKACPKIQELRVREIAPVGEEVDMVECTSSILDTDTLATEALMSVSSRGVSSVNVPFNITPAGVVVVSKPLIYRNNIQDIQIINVTFIYQKDGGDPSTNCNRTETKVTVKIIVEKSDCPTNWTYEVKRNLYLAVAPVLTMPQALPENCMSVCSANESLMCNGFNYNVVKKECLLLNETEFTQTNMTKKRMGMFLYRKYCKTDQIPMAVLRNAFAGVENASTLGTSASVSILEKLLPALQSFTDTSIQDIKLTISIFHHVANKTDLVNATKQQLETFMQICGQVFDLLLSKPKPLGTNKKTKIDRILVVFDTLIESLSRSERVDWHSTHVISDMTAFSIQEIVEGKSQSYAMGSRTGISGFRLNFPSQDKIGKLNKTTLVTGTIDGLKDVLTPVLAGETTEKRSLTVTGQVVSVILEPAPTGPFEIQLDISTHDSGVKETSRICAFLQKRSDSTGLWDTEGCWLVKYNSSHTRCRCTHMTNFAVLMQVTPFQLEEIHIASLEILTIIGCCISIAALSTTVTVLLWFRLRSERYILLLHLSVAVVVAQVVFLTGIDAVNMKIVCRLVAILLHYLYLSVFTLMLAEGIHLFHKLHRAFDADDSLNMLLFLGWGSPFVIVSLSLLSAGDGYSTQQHCWLSTDGAIWAFVGPALTIIAINMAILIMIIRTFLGVTIVARKTDMQKFKASLKATVVLLPLLGITWMFGVVAVNESTVVFQYIFAILNSLQGLFIFLFHIVFNDDVRKACSHYKRNQITSVDSLPQSSASKKLHKKANLYSTTTSL